MRLVSVQKGTYQTVKITGVEILYSICNSYDEFTDFFLGLHDIYGQFD